MCLFLKPLFLNSFSIIGATIFLQVPGGTVVSIMRSEFGLIILPISEIDFLNSSNFRDISLLFFFISKLILHTI